MEGCDYGLIWGTFAMIFSEESGQDSQFLDSDVILWVQSPKYKQEWYPLSHSASGYASFN